MFAASFSSAAEGQLFGTLQARLPASFWTGERARALEGARTNGSNVPGGVFCLREQRGATFWATRAAIHRPTNVGEKVSYDPSKVVGFWVEDFCQLTPFGNVSASV
jgi:hypothetical protein